MKRTVLFIGLTCELLLLCCGLLLITTSSEEYKLKRLLNTYSEEFSTILSVCQDAKRSGQDRYWWQLTRKNITEDTYPFYDDINDINITAFPNEDISFEQISPLIDACRTIFEAYPFDVIYVSCDYSGKVFIEFHQTKQERDRYRGWYLVYMETGHDCSPINWAEHTLRLYPEDSEIAPNWYVLTRLRDELG